MDVQVFETHISSGFKVLSIPPHRSLLFLAICTIQSVVALLLLLVGIEWLTSTTEIVDLLLNGVALEYIMDIDELIYDVFVPMKIATFMDLLQPLPSQWPWLCPIRGVVLISIGVVVLAFAVMQLDAQLTDVIVVRNTLCSDPV